jgi:hypothetical protein
MNPFENVVEQMRAITSAGGQIMIASKGGPVEVKGSRSIGPMAAAFLSRKAEKGWRDEVEALLLGGLQHAPGSVLGRAQRNLLKWYRGDKILEGGDRHGVESIVSLMAREIYAHIHDSQPDEPNEETKWRIDALKSLIDANEWVDRISEWPTEICDAIDKNPPNKDIPVKPPPGLIRDNYWINKRAAEGFPSEGKDDDADIPF